MEGDGDGALALVVGGEEEGSEGAPGLTRLEREKSVQYPGIPPHPVLKLLHTHTPEKMNMKYKA